MTTTERCAVYFVEEGYSTQTPRLLGRNAAGEGFLRAYFNNPPGGEVACVYRTPSEMRSFAVMARNKGLQDRLRAIPMWRLKDVTAVGNLYSPGPNLGKFAWARRRFGAAHFSICGITHTTASHFAMDSIADTLVAPVEPWDALICTSEAVVRSMSQLLDRKEVYLRERLGASRIVRPTLARIPLGVHMEDFVADAGTKKIARQAMELSQDEIVFLFVGRLSFHAKANPLPMYMALEIAAKKCEKRLTLVQVGWFANDKIESAFRESANALCPSVRTVFLDGRDAVLRKQSWQAADVFTSLSDNIQETFGLTPVEAMAAGLPCVVSDWDGYRDTVRRDTDGFLIPTYMPAPGLGSDLAARYEDEVDNYDRYIAGTSLFVAVDVQAAALAYERLARDEPLRRQMGRAAQQYASEVFDWTQVLKRYGELWSELAERRKAHVPPASAEPNPSRDDPYRFFPATRAPHFAPRIESSAL